MPQPVYSSKDFRPVPGEAANARPVTEGPAQAATAPEAPAVPAITALTDGFSEPVAIPPFKMHPAHVPTGAIAPYAGPRVAPLDPSLAQQEDDAAILEAVRQHNANHVVLDYAFARHAMFTYVDNEGGTVEDVYAGKRAELDGDVGGIGPDGMNTEHTWPQSELKQKGALAAISDLHHLFPVDAQANSRRSNHPFGEVSQPTWSEGGSSLGYDDAGRLVYDTRDEHGGDAARGKFHVSALYGLPIDDAEEKVLREWAAADPVDAEERERNEKIAQVQGSRNPFVDHPDLVSRIDDF